MLEKARQFTVNRRMLITEIIFVSMFFELSLMLVTCRIKSDRVIIFNVYYNNYYKFVIIISKSKGYVF